MKTLTWHFDNSQWWALSAIGDGDDPFVWRINVTENGHFTIDSTDQELRLGCGDIPCAFDSLRLAEYFCERNERSAMQAYSPYVEEA